MGLEKLAVLKQQLAADAKAAKEKKVDKNQAVDPAVLVIGRLQKLFPNTFPKSPAPKVPLKIGILNDLTERSEEISISKEDLHKAIQTWCRGQRYWSASIEGAQRINLDGIPSGIVDANGAAQARAMMNKRRSTQNRSMPQNTDEHQKNMRNKKL
ncbi:ProQ/FinO family protein [Methylophilus sp. 5]|uniref:ProQ/FinO family protein n=1 Tax=Methylophilus sp. 5 TaxID=1112274 RepID=UPI00048BFBE7|nr:ProQ/FinO family protein [Methylophilus sp. 5]